jgi:hypothetical protein
LSSPPPYAKPKIVVSDKSLVACNKGNTYHSTYPVFKTKKKKKRREKEKIKGRKDF